MYHFMLSSFVTELFRLFVNFKKIKKLQGSKASSGCGLLMGRTTCIVLKCSYGPDLID